MTSDARGDVSIARVARRDVGRDAYAAQLMPPLG